MIRFELISDWPLPPFCLGLQKISLVNSKTLGPSVTSYFPQSCKAVMYDRVLYTDPGYSTHIIVLH